MTDADKQRGIYRKFEVRRTDGRDAPGEKHHDCYYFVLDLDHDKHAVPALRAYAESCEREYPLLSTHLIIMAERVLEGLRPVEHLPERDDG